jgi:uncharacterized protein (TIGR03086 family)
VATDIRALIVSAVTAMTVAVDQVPDTAWDQPTPCPGWTVRDVVDHVTREQTALSRALTSQPGDVSATAIEEGEDVASAWRQTAAEATEAWADADLDRPLDLPSGPTTVADHAELVLLNLVVHRWDVQRGAGTGIEVDGAAVTHVLEWALAHPAELEATGGFAPAVDVESEYADDRLMALLGRDPRLDQA